MYQIKYRKGYREAMQPCEAIEVTRIPRREDVDPELDYDDAFGGREAGYYVELIPTGRVICLPRDADVLYVMNEAGDTVHTYYWPEKRADRKVG